MKTAIRGILIYSTLFFFSSCLNNSTDPTGTTPKDEPGITLSGTVSLNGKGVSGATVELDDVVNWRTTTDSFGGFKLIKLSTGKHEIKIHKELSNNQISEQNTSIYITEKETIMDPIKLAQPPTLYNINPSTIVNYSGSVKWSKSKESEFKEYKIYKGQIPGVDAVNGDLIFSTTSINDTFFIDPNLRTGIPYYYRVYTGCNLGKTAGSNIISLTLPEFNFVTNPGFETSDDGILPSSWLQYTEGTPSFKYYQLDKQTFKEGKSSVKIIYIDSLTVPGPRGSAGGLTQPIYTSDLVEGLSYTVSFWAKVDIGRLQVLVVKNGDFTKILGGYYSSGVFDWTEQKFTFKTDSETRSILLWISTGEAFAKDGLVKAWIDNIKLLK